MRIPYNKPPLTVADQLKLIQSRGIIIDFPAAAAEFLLKTNYYRFAGYALHFEIFEKEKRTDHFVPGTKFEDVVEIFHFDTQLKRLLLKHLEPVEIAFRTALCYEMAMSTGEAFWHLDAGNFFNQDFHSMFIENCVRDFERSSENFIGSYKQKYNSRILPPSWMLIEIAPFGCWAKVYRNINLREHQKRVANHFSTSSEYLDSWIFALSVLRNLCAHHSRIWNRTLPIRPLLSRKMKPYVSNPERIGASIAALRELLKPLSMTKSFDEDLNKLLTEYPKIPVEKMGLVLKPGKGKQP